MPVDKEEKFKKRFFSSPFSNSTRKKSKSSKNDEEEVCWLNDDTMHQFRWRKIPASRQFWLLRRSWPCTRKWFNRHLREWSIYLLSRNKQKYTDSRKKKIDDRKKNIDRLLHVGIWRELDFYMYRKLILEGDDWIKGFLNGVRVEVNEVHWDQWDHWSIVRWWHRRVHCRELAGRREDCPWLRRVRCRCWSSFPCWLHWWMLLLLFAKRWSPVSTMLRFSRRVAPARAYPRTAWSVDGEKPSNTDMSRETG